MLHAQNLCMNISVHVEYRIFVANYMIWRKIDHYVQNIMANRPLCAKHFLSLAVVSNKLLTLNY